MSLLAPSVLAADFSILKQQIRAVELGGADIIHCDIMDGSFVPNITFGPKIVETLNSLTKLPIDVHLMIKHPETIIGDFVKCGADMITVHQEEVVHLDRMIHSIKEMKVKAGIALNPATSIHSLSNVYHLLDHILVMTVNPGFGGQSLIDYTLDKVKELDRIRKENNYEYRIEIDGGVTEHNIAFIKNSGCDIIVAGTAVFGNENITEQTTKLKNLIL